MFDTHAIIKKVVKDFFLGTGEKPTLDEYNKALNEIDKDHADGASVNKAYNLWLQYHRDMAESLPIWKRPLPRSRKKNGRPSPRSTAKPRTGLPPWRPPRL